MRKVVGGKEGVKRGKGEKERKTSWVKTFQSLRVLWLVRTVGHSIGQA